MKIDLKYVIFYLSFFAFTSSFSQVKDIENTSFRIPAEPSNNGNKRVTESINTPETLNNKNSKNKNDFNFLPEKKSFSMVYDDGLKNPGEHFEDRWKKEAEKSGLITTMSDQFLGEHRIESSFVNIICRDHEFPDGDRVRIYNNGEIIAQNLTLRKQYRRVKINLTEGRNKIDIEALNQGTSGPNTAEFIVYDDQGKVVSSKEWLLLTGVKATIIFINKKMTIVPKSE